MSLVRKQVVEDANTHAQSFGNAQPFRHIVIDDFLVPSVCRGLLDHFPGFEDRYALNEMGEVGGKAVRMDVREFADVYRQLDSYLQTTEFLQFVSKVTGIPELLYDPEYIGGGTHENRDGQRLDQHVDFNFHPGTRWHRRLNLIVYLNPEWDEAWGGNLQLQADPWNGDSRGPTVVPVFNRAVIFETTERSWHGFSTISLPAECKALSRKSFAIYLYTKERPADETALSHATVYVPEAMPVALKPGLTLDESHVVDLRQRFERMLGQLRFLYDREKDFAAQIATFEKALDQARGALRLPLRGYAEQPHAPQGIWPDGWVDTEFASSFVPERKLRGVQLELWVPDQLDADQVLDIELNGKRWQHHVARGSRSNILLELQCAAGRAVELRIRAARAFVPAKAGSSADERRLAWKLLGASLIHS